MNSHNPISPAARAGILDLIDDWVTCNPVELIAGCSTHHDARGRRHHGALLRDLTITTSATGISAQTLCALDVGYRYLDVDIEAAELFMEARIKNGIGPDKNDYATLAMLREVRSRRCAGADTHPYRAAFTHHRNQPVELELIDSLATSFAATFQPQLADLGIDSRAFDIDDMSAAASDRRA